MGQGREGCGRARDGSPAGDNVTGRTDDARGFVKRHWRRARRVETHAEGGGMPEECGATAGGRGGVPDGGEARARGVPKDGCKRLPPIVHRMVTNVKDTGRVQRSVGCGWRGGGGTRFDSHRYGRLVQTGDRMSRRSDHLFATSLSMRSLFPHVFTPRSDVFTFAPNVFSPRPDVFTFVPDVFSPRPHVFTSSAVRRLQQSKGPRRERRGLARVRALEGRGVTGGTGWRAGLRLRRVRT